MYAQKYEFPDYINKLTPAAEFKKRKLDEIKTFEQMSSEEYAQSLGALILSSQDGTKWALFHQMGNSVKIFLADEVKTLANDESFKSFVNYHKGVLKQKSIESEINYGSYWKDHLLSEYDIVWSESNDQDQDQRDDDADSRLPVIEEHFSVAPERPADSGDESGADSRLPAGEQGGTAGHNRANATEWTNTVDRGQDGEGPTAPSTGSLSDTIAKIRSHGPHS